MMRRRFLRNDPRLPEVERIVDTRQLPEGDRLPGIGDIWDGALETYHVTDEPAAVLRAIRRRTNVVASYGEKGATAELGPGLYFSGVPEFWVGRARGKWDFLTGLQGDPLDRLLDAIQSEIARLRRITDSERGYATRLIDGVRSGLIGAEALTALASQPFGLAFWKPDFLDGIGIRAGKPPSIVKVEIVGRLAKVRGDRPSPATLRALRRMGVVGAYKFGSMASNPELVIWDARAIRSARETRL